MNIKITSKDSKFYYEFTDALANWNGKDLLLWGKYWGIQSLKLLPPFEVDVELILIKTAPVKKEKEYVKVPCDLPHYPEYPIYPSNPFYPDITPCTPGYPPGTIFCTSTDINPTSCGASGLFLDFQVHN